MNRSHLRYFRGSFLVTITGILLAFYMGGNSAEGFSLAEGLSVMFIVAVLAVLEISLSFDNAVVNATVLKDMDEKWRRRFLTWGILIAVFGMRIIFPVLVVSVVAQINPWAALELAVSTPDEYARVMTEAHVSVMAFGGAFLMMVGLDFFLDDEKEHWIPFVEQPIVHLGKLRFAAEVITVLAIMAVAQLALPVEESRAFMISGIAGILTFTAIHKLSAFMEAREQARAAEHAAKSGAAMFLYLELLDASFSFDGVIGAFAITTDLFIIAIGLGIGAMFVRSLTILLVEKDTLAEYQYLEHGAFYAIIALATIMFLKTFVHIPEVVTGLIGAGFIAVAFVHSVMENKNAEAGQEQA
ncbi:MAG: DUF475 domain-containing protein [Pseudomonadales bacterium]|nr:DUF475 domain-containing protein [Pseudomonadales bacterium]